MQGHDRGAEPEFEEEEVFLAPVKPMRVSVFWRDYEKLTVGQILTQAAAGDNSFRDRIIVKERQSRGRQAVIMPLVNWNS